MRQHPLVLESAPPPSQPSATTPAPTICPVTSSTTSRPPFPRAACSRASKGLPRSSSPPRARYAEEKRSPSRTPSPPLRRHRHYHSRPRPKCSRSPSIPRSDIKLLSRSPRRAPVKLREPQNRSGNKAILHVRLQVEATLSTIPVFLVSVANWDHSKCDTRSSSWHSSDTPRDHRQTPSGPPVTAFSKKQKPSRGKDTSKLPSSSTPPPGKVPLADPGLKDEEWIRTVKKNLDDPTRCASAKKIKPGERPVLEDYVDPAIRDNFISQMKQIHDDMPPSKIQSLLQVVGASGLLEEVDFNRVQCHYLPNTSQRAMVVRLSHIKRFKEKPAFLNEANYSYAMVHGTNLIGAKYCLAEAVVRPADWSYCEYLSKCEQPTYGCFALGSCATSRENEIPNWHLVDLLDRATTKGKGQQEILLALQYKGAKEHLALKAGGNDMVQLQCALRGVVTTSEKYTVARSEHCTIRSLILVLPDLSFIESRKGQSATYKPVTSKEQSKEATDDSPDDRPPDPDSYRSYHSWHRGRDRWDEEDET
eukprot:s534_g23.t1